VKGIRTCGLKVFFAVLTGWTAAAAAATPVPASREDFFIVSSVDSGKNTIVLKRPTEVTLTMRFTPKTRCSSERGKSIHCTDLRAGDTVFIASESGAAGEPVASSIRQGPMTVEELRRRYLRP
jgi:hypothetical protein